MTKRSTQQSPGGSRWGYDRPLVECKSDPGYCSYLQDLSASHDRGLIYTGILWATIGAILLVWVLLRWLLRVGTGRTRQRHLVTTPALDTLERRDEFHRLSLRRRSHIQMLSHGLAATFRSILLPDIALRSVFGQTTRLQVVILAVLLGYLTVWSFVDIAYTAWKAPINSQSPNIDDTRASLASFSNRVGTLAFSLTPLSVLLATRESLLSIITGIPHTSFLFLHRWTGYIILALAAIHTAGWCIVKIRLGGQPQAWNTFADATHARWGIAAMCTVFLMTFLSRGWTIRRLTGYEFFRKTHYLLSVLYMGACIGHWKKLDVFLIPALALWLIDRFIRIVRMGTLHYSATRGHGLGWLRFSTIQADATLWHDERYGDIIRLDFLQHLQQKKPPWKVGQHFFLCFTEGSIWQSHPFTPLSLPISVEPSSFPPTDQHQLRTKHSYLFRAKAGETKRIGKLIADKIDKHKRDLAGDEDCKRTTAITTPVILQGPYGRLILSNDPDSEEPNQTRTATNVDILCIAGGTGISYVLPVILHYLGVEQGTDRSPREEISDNRSQSYNRENTRPKRKIELIWTIKRANDIQWIAPELEELQNTSNVWKTECDFRVRLFVTGEAGCEVTTPRNKKILYSAGATTYYDVPTSPPSSTSTASFSSRNGSPACLEKENDIPEENNGPPEMHDLNLEIETEHKRPDFPLLLKEFIDNVAQGPIQIFASGPPGMTRGVRSAVAGCNSGRRVWKGDDRFDVRLVCDDRSC